MTEGETIDNGTVWWRISCEVQKEKYMDKRGGASVISEDKLKRAQLAI